jgi:hypothetical protein
MLKIKGLSEAFSKIDDTVDYFQNHSPLYDCSAKVEHEVWDVLSRYKETLRAKMQSGTQTTLDLLFAKRRPRGSTVP